MRNRKQSTSIIAGAGVLMLTVTVLTVWATGRTTSEARSEASTVQTKGSSSRRSASSSQVAVASQEPEPATTTIESTQEAPASTTPLVYGMQLAQVVTGDFASMEGTWVNGDGETLTFGAAGLIDGKGQVQGLKQTGYGTARGYLATETIGGGTLELLPAGTVFPAYVYDRDGVETTVADASDSQQDRIWLGHDLISIAEPSSFYYRVH